MTDRPPIDFLDWSMKDWTTTHDPEGIEATALIALAQDVRRIADHLDERSGRTAGSVAERYEITLSRHGDQWTATTLLTPLEGAAFGSGASPLEALLWLLEDVGLVTQGDVTNWLQARGPEATRDGGRS